MWQHSSCCASIVDALPWDCRLADPSPFVLLPLQLHGGLCGGIVSVRPLLLWLLRLPAAAREGPDFIVPPAVVGLARAHVAAGVWAHQLCSARVVPLSSTSAFTSTAVCVGSQVWLKLLSPVLTPCSYVVPLVFFHFCRKWTTTRDDICTNDNRGIVALGASPLACCVMSCSWLGGGQPVQHDAAASAFLLLWKTAWLVCGFSLLFATI